MSTTINGTTGVAVGGTVTATSGWAGTTSSAGILGGVAVSHECERTGTGTATNFMAWGNGNAGNKGIRMPFAGKLYAATLVGQTITGTVTVQAGINGTPNASYQMSATGAGGQITATGNWLSSPLSFAAGDLLGWYQAVVPSSADGYQVAFYIVFN